MGMIMGKKENRSTSIKMALDKQRVKGSAYSSPVRCTAIEMPEHMKQNAKVFEFKLKESK